MPVAVLQPFSSCGTVDTPITASHSMPSRARRRRPPHRIPSYHILGYLGQRDEPYPRYQVIFRIMDVMIMDVISEEYTAQPPMAEAIVHQGLGARNQ